MTLESDAKIPGLQAGEGESTDLIFHVRSAKIFVVYSNSRVNKLLAPFERAFPLLRTSNPLTLHL